MIDPAVRQMVIRQVTEPAISFYHSLEFLLQRKTAPEEERLRATRDLGEVSFGIVRLLKKLIDANEEVAVESALHEWIRESPRNSFEDDADDLRHFAANAEGDQKRELERRLAALVPFANASREARIAQASALIQLGGWLTRKLRKDGHERDRHESLTACLNAIAGAVRDGNDVVAVLAQFFGSSHEFALLEQWHSHEMIAAGISSWSGSRSDDGLYFAALLLLRLFSPGEPPIIEPASSSAHVREQMGDQVDSVLEDREFWSSLLPEDSDLRAESLKGAWRSAEERQRKLERERVANADLSSDRIQTFRRGNARAFREAQGMAATFRRAGAAASDTDASPFESDMRQARVIHQFMPKSWFVDDEPVIGLDEDIGRDMARDQDTVAYEKLRDAAVAANPVRTPDLIPPLLHHLDEMRRTTGALPTILAPRDYFLREVLVREATFEAHTDFARGRLAGAEVFFLPVSDSEPLILVDTSQVVFEEFVYPGETSPLWITVESISREMAGASVDAGFEFSDGPSDSDAAISRLVAERVNVDIRAAFDFKGDLSANVVFPRLSDEGPPNRTDRR